MRQVLGGGLAVLVTGWIGSAAAAATLYGVTGDGGSAPETLYTLSQTDASRTFVRAFGNGDDGEVIAFDPDAGLLYHASGFGAPNDPVAGEVLETFDPTTTAVASVPLSGADYDEARGFTYDTGADALLLADRGQRFYSLSTGGVASLIGSLDHQSKGLAFVGLDLYSIENDNPNLHRIDRADGSTLASVAITLAGEAVNGATGLALDPDTGVLWALLKLDFQAGRELVMLEPTTGVASRIGNTGENFAGIAFVPEPSTGLLLAFGLAGIARRRTHFTR